MYYNDKYYKVTDTEGKAWKEWLSDEWVSKYQSWGWSVEYIKD